ncbi:MAG: putative toxin-antitoxin system toxin component, PIN family [Deltaproteobacteria bacterium]|nr:putative toxin-antitoxin system toxin component, PIN family [Deltaproteobacteria bacterium]MBW1955686.1 putative toxin-antitoxin system toxin component, PIN family [Deltaproteobacteria bacterium]MBW2041175.1 putative toxin-antitoxin system toxin component, PIN family [Deltaproteobacteria bacterium]MBW2131959.1 putative toxin-antitoxin system toxin component, PIN family [Deltaproteobacteria bacterium]
MRVVLDTNVWVSGLLSPFGPPGTIVRMVTAGKLLLCMDARILAEYHDVFLRPKFHFNKRRVETIIEFIRYGSHFVSAPPLDRPLPDKDDEPFLEVALAGKVECLITGNTAHYPVSLRQGMTVFSPSEFLEFYHEKRGD